MPTSSNGMPIGVIENSENGSMVCAPGGRLRSALAIRSLSRISGEFEISVMLVPARMQNAIGSSRRFNGTPVRAEMRLATGRNNAASAWLWMIDERLPTVVLSSSDTRLSTPPERRRMKDAALLSIPVRSRPAPMIMMPISDNTALEAKPSNNCCTGISPVMPITTTTSSATMSARTHSRISMITVKPTSPSTSIMSGVRVSSIGPKVRSGQFAWVGGQSLHTVVQQISNRMAEIDPAPLETRFDPPRRPLRFTAFPFAQSPARLRGQHFPHVRSILGPVGGEVQQAARFHARRQQFGKCGLDQPPLVVALLGPRIREPDAHFVERGFGNFVAQHVDGVVVPDSHVAYVARRQCIHQAADAGTMHLDAEVIARGIVFARPCQAFAIAEADLQHARRRSTEQRIDVAWLALVVDPEIRPVFRERALLRGRDAAFPQDKAADGARVFGTTFVVQTGAQAINPSTGLEAEA